MNKLTTNNKQDNVDTLAAAEWNELVNTTNALIDRTLEVTVDDLDSSKSLITLGGIPVGELTDKGDKGINVTVAGNNNINIEPRVALGTGEGKNKASDANRKGGNISLKPGDDIELCSHKRGTSKCNEVAVKAIDGSDNPIELELVAGEFTLSSKDKGSTKKKDNTGYDIETPYCTTSTYSGGSKLPVVSTVDTSVSPNVIKYYLASANDKNATATETEVSSTYVTSAYLYNDPNVTNVNITTGNGKGYLKVRAQAIDLRCEDHGGIALQPKGFDGSGNMNKIKFEHGGGDGLEFGTFNTEKSSLYTDEYRFKKDGVLKLATRTTETSDKADVSDATTSRKYVKQADDFYDVISSEDPTCTWESVIKTANALNEADTIRTYISNGNLAVENNNMYYISTSTPFYPLDSSKTVIDTNLRFALYDPVSGIGIQGGYYQEGYLQMLGDIVFGRLYTAEELSAMIDTSPSSLAGGCYVTAPPVQTGSRETFEVVEVPATDITVKVADASCNMSDVIALVNWMKTNNQGPWSV